MTAPAPDFPDCVPLLVDPASGVTLRAHGDEDLDDLVEECNDPDVRRWTTVPTPQGGYALADARSFIDDVVAPGWRDRTRLTWAIEAPRPSSSGGTAERRFCGSIDLRMTTPDQKPGDRLRTGGLGEVGFALHPAARGRGVMSSALRLVVAYGFDEAGLDAIRWRAHTGNWPSRRVAAAAGFRHDGTIRSALAHRGRFVDAWSATITADDPRTPQRGWSDAPRLEGTQTVLRRWRDTDADRVAEACGEARTAHWLAGLPQPYLRTDALDWLEHTREEAAAGIGYHWCVADPETDRCLGSITLTGFGGYARRGEIGYWAHPEARGRGVITEAVRLVTAFAESGPVDSLQIRVAEGNTSSRHVAESAGYTFAGTLPRSEPLGDGSIVDLHTFSRP